MRVKVDYRSCSKNVYNDYVKLNSSNIISFDKWKNIIYTFNEMFRDYLLETGDKEKLPAGFGEFGINKKIRKKIIIKDGKEYINLPVDWKKTKEKGKKIYNFNHETEGFFFGWVWFKKVAMIKQPDLWYFKASRCSSRLIAHYLKTDSKYKDIYRQWST